MAELPPVQFLDIGATYRELRAEIDAAHASVLSSGWYLLGERLDRFEHDFASYVGAAACVGVASGMDALCLALRALEVGPGDEVLVPSNTYIATWLAVSAVGAVPVPVEPDPDTANLDASGLQAALTGRTRAVLPVHLYGRAAPIDEIVAFARRHDLVVVEDAAQAHGARHAGRRIGASGDAVAWSFYPGKNLGAFADAGAVTTDDAEVADRVRLLRNYGSRVKYHNEVRGVNSRMDELSAAVLAVKLPVLDEWNARRTAIAATYRRELDDLDGIVVPPAGHVGADGTDDCVWHQFVIRSDRRDELCAGLEAKGVPTLIHYPVPPHLQPAYADLGLEAGSLPVAERWASTVLSLPIGPHLPDADVERVVLAVREVAAELAGDRR